MGPYPSQSLVDRQLHCNHLSRLSATQALALPLCIRGRPVRQPRAGRGGLLVPEVVVRVGLSTLAVGHGRLLARVGFPAIVPARVAVMGSEVPLPAGKALLACLGVSAGPGLALRRG